MLKRPSMSQMRSLARCARRCASRSGIISPVYSAIFLRRRNAWVAKQPLPSIGDLLIERPGASLSFTSRHCTRYRTARDSKRVVRSVRSPTIREGLVIERSPAGQFEKVARASRPWNHAQECACHLKLTHYLAQPLLTRGLLTGLFTRLL